MQLDAAELDLIACSCCVPATMTLLAAKMLDPATLFASARREKGWLTDATLVVRIALQVAARICGTLFRCESMQ
jgi:hypothetical protein